MRVQKTPELAKMLAPALNAAHDAAQTMESALDTGRPDDREFAFEVRSTYEELRDDVLKKLKMPTIKNLFLSADAAIDSGDIHAVDLLRNTWKVAEDPLVTHLREADDEVKSLEAELTRARERRGEIASWALSAGITQYELAKSIGRNESSISSWKQSYLQKKK